MRITVFNSIIVAMIFRNYITLPGGITTNQVINIKLKILRQKKVIE